MNARFLTAVLLVAVLLLCERFAAAQPGPAENEQYTVRVYQLADMILPLPNHGYRPNDLPATPAESATGGQGGSQGGGFGGGGGGFGGGNFGGGGAAFNFQPEGGQGGAQGSGFNPAQGGVGGGFGGAGGTAATSFADDAMNAAMEAIVELITASIEPASWEDVGGSGTIRSYRSMLIISQTAAVHAKIGEFLSALRQETGTLRTVTVAAHWLMLDSDELAKLQVERDGVSSIDRDALAKLTRQEGNYRGQITCFSGQTVHLVGGQRRNVVTGLIPVVGGDNPAYQPRGGTPNIGVLLQVRPTLVADASAAIVDLESWVTAAPKHDAMIEFQSGRGVPAAASEGKQSSGKADAAGVRVDRLDIASHALATTLRAPVGAPVLAGGLSVVSADTSAGGGERKQLYLVVQVNVADYQRGGDAKKTETRR